MTQQLTQTNKELVLGFLKMMIVEGKPKEAAAKYLGPYKQHNPNVPDGPEGVVQWVGGMLKQFPKMTYDIKRVLQDGEYVVVHGHFKTGPGDRGSAGVDIFRCQNGKIVEHWDVMQPIPEKAANNNTMF